MRDQLDCYFVGSWITGECPRCELGKLLVVTGRKVGSDLSDVLLDDVEVVQQPVPGRADVEAPLRAAVQLVIDPVENSTSIFEAEQERADSALFLRREQMMPSRDCTRAFTEALETQHFSANWADEFFPRPISRTPE